MLPTLHASCDQEMYHQSRSSDTVLSRAERDRLNEMERERTRRTNEYFVSLRNILQMANIPTRKDKLSILKNAHGYILQLREVLHVIETRIARIQVSVASENSFDRMGEGGAVEHGGQGYVRIGPSEDGLPISTTRLFTHAGVAMVLVDLNGFITDYNGAFLQLTGFTREDMESRGVSVLNFASLKIWNNMIHMDQAVQIFWSPCLFKDREELCFVSLWLIFGDTAEQRRHFHMSVSPASACTGSDFSV